jgi:hypothetical protein
VVAVESPGDPFETEAAEIHSDDGHRLRSARPSNLLSAVIGSLIATVAALGGTYIGSHATVTAQRDQAQETRRAEARIKRADVYSAFLSAASAAVAPSFRAWDLCTTQTNQFQCRSSEPERIYAKASEQLVNADYQVLIYGSAAGVEAARRVMASLPVALFPGGIAEQTINPNDQFD